MFSRVLLSVHTNVNGNTNSDDKKPTERNHMKHNEVDEVEQDELQTLKITGRFTFSPLDDVTLSGLISHSRLVNKRQLLEALFWPESDHRLEECTLADSAKCKRNEMRLIAGQLRHSLKPEVQGTKATLEYCLFSHTETFFEESGYRRAMSFLNEQGYACPKLLWFISFVLGLSEICTKLNFASPVPLETENQCLYPYYRDETGDGDDDARGMLWFDPNYGDVGADLDLAAMNQSLMFGVKKIE